MPARFFTLFLLFFMLIAAHAFGAGDTVSIYFPFNKYTLSEAARQKLGPVTLSGDYGNTAGSDHWLHGSGRRK